MKVVITGGAGFLGQRLARALLARGQLNGPDGRPRPIGRLVLADVVAPPDLGDPRVATVVGDLSDPAVLARAIEPGTGSVFHLAAVVSGQAEADFDLGWRINLDAARALLERCRALGQAPRVVFTSSVAVYGPGPQDGPGYRVDDATALQPRSSYGVQKAVGELLLADYSRKGYVDGRCLRLPTISVRPGKPNAAASSFASGIVREPLAGLDAVVPVAADTRLWLLSPGRAIACLIDGHELDAAALQGRRSLNLPGVSVTVAEMVQALQRVAGDAPLRHLRWARDERIEAIVGSWPAAWDTGRARALGLQGDDGFDDIVRAYAQEAGLGLAG